MKEIQRLLEDIGSGYMPSTVYDTAWVARLGSIDKEMSYKALNWICEHQLPDGSWGASEPFYYHDRVICTLAAMIALTRMGKRAHDRKQIEFGQMALERITRGATGGLKADPNGATVGFELIAPTLVDEAVRLNILKQQGDRILGRLARKRALKLAALNGRKINRYMTAVFSAEMAGSDAPEMLAIEKLQEVNGSLGNSPSATAYYALEVCPNDPAAMAYLRKVMNPDGGVPNVAPFEIFERAWTLWNLALTGPLDQETLNLCKPHLDFLQGNWKPGKGIATWVAKYTPEDGDDTGLVFEVLSRFGYSVDIEAVLSYEEDDYFRCFAMEADHSISTHVHILGAFKAAGLAADHPSVKKAVDFMKRTQKQSGYWTDKWHISPYYTTAHAVIACAGFDPQMCKYAVEWLLASQNEDGSWGYFLPTAEETAYVIQALCFWKKQGEIIPDNVIEQGAAWLSEHRTLPFPPLWIGKCLYAPVKVIKSSILSALQMASEET